MDLAALEEAILGAAHSGRGLAAWVGWRVYSAILDRYGHPPVVVLGVPVHYVAGSPPDFWTIR